MGIVDMEWYAYRLPFRGRFGTAHSVMALREGAIVELRTEDGIVGIGEIAPLPEFGGGTLGDALVALATVAPRLRGTTLDEALACVQREQEAGSISPSCACGLEIALLDALGKMRGCSVGELLCTEVGTALGCPPNPTNHKSQSQITITNHSVPVNAVIGVGGIEAAVEGARQAVAAGFGCVKLKMGEGSYEEERARVAAVRKAIGPVLHLRLDANEAWTFEQASAILMGCAHYDIQYVEQPLVARDLAGMRRLRQTVAVPIAADEALYDLASARRVLAQEAADILIIKPQLVGGLRVGRLIIEEAARCGVQCVVTSALEAGIGLVGVLHLVAASPEVTLECGLATLPLLEDDLLENELPVIDGFLAVPEGPGLGVRLDRAAVKKYM